MAVDVYESSVDLCVFPASVAHGELLFFLFFSFLRSSPVETLQHFLPSWLLASLLLLILLFFLGAHTTACLLLSCLFLLSIFLPFFVFICVVVLLLLLFRLVVSRHCGVSLAIVEISRDISGAVRGRTRSFDMQELLRMHGRPPHLLFADFVFSLVLFVCVYPLSFSLSSVFVLLLLSGVRTYTQRIF